MSNPVEYLCIGLPIEFSNYLHYCRSLRFEDRPDYTYLKKMLKEVLYKENTEFDYVYDWTFVEQPKKAEIPVEAATATVTKSQL